MKIRDGRFLLHRKGGMIMVYPSLEQAIEIRPKASITCPWRWTTGGHGDARQRVHALQGHEPLLLPAGQRGGRREMGALLVHRPRPFAHGAHKAATRRSSHAPRREHEKRTGNPFRILEDVMGVTAALRFRGCRGWRAARSDSSATTWSAAWKTCRIPPPDDLGLPDCHFIVADEILAFDHLSRSCR